MKILEYMEACMFYARAVVNGRRSREWWDKERTRLWSEMSDHERKVAVACTTIEQEVTCDE